jgi:hypothetical protein
MIITTTMTTVTTTATSGVLTLASVEGLHQAGRLRGGSPRLAAVRTHRLQTRSAHTCRERGKKGYYNMYTRLEHNNITHYKTKDTQLYEQPTQQHILQNKNTLQTKQHKTTQQQYNTQHISTHYTPV